MNFLQYFRSMTKTVSLRFYLRSIILGMFVAVGIAEQNYLAILKALKMIEVKTLKHNILITF